MRHRSAAAEIASASKPVPAYARAGAWLTRVLRSLGRCATIGVLMGAGAVSCARADDEAGFAAARAAMVREIEASVSYTRHEIGKAKLDPRVMQAMATVPRHEFVPARYLHEAYENHPLPIGYRQTISQPYIVALMTDLAEPDPDDVVLEIGTGSGYQAAVLAELVEEVYTIEIIEELGEGARDRLARLGYDNVEVRVGDGFYGWPAKAPFDAILIAAAVDEIPQPLVDQLRAGGRLVLPEGDPAVSQDLVVVEKNADGTLDRRFVIPVRFVPLTGDH